MVKVAILYFAGARDVVRKRQELIDVGSRATAGDVLNHIIREHPGLRPMKKSLRISVNSEVVGPSAVVREGDEIGVLPPVAGG